MTHFIPPPPQPTTREDLENEIARIEAEMAKAKAEPVESLSMAEEVAREILGPKLTKGLKWGCAALVFLCFAVGVFVLAVACRLVFR